MWLSYTRTAILATHALINTFPELRNTENSDVLRSRAKADPTKSSTRPTAGQGTSPGCGLCSGIVRDPLHVSKKKVEKFLGRELNTVEICFSQSG